MVGVRNAQKVPMFFRLIKLNEIFSHVENIKRRMACMNSLPTYLRLIE